MTDEEKRHNYPSRELDISDQIKSDRVQEIGEARRAIREIRTESQFAVMHGEMTYQGRELSFREALESFLLEVKQYRDVDDTAEAYWNGDKEDNIGEVIIHPPNEDTFSDCEPVLVDVITSLDDILRAPAFYEHTFETTVDGRHSQTQTRRETVKQPIPKPVLDMAVEWVNDYVKHIGLDLPLQKMADDQAEAY